MQSSLFRRLSNDLIFVIGEYLLQLDFHCVLNSSKREFCETKAETIHYSLNPVFSLKFLWDIKFRKLILSKVRDSVKQLSLNFINCYLSSKIYDIDFIPLSSVVTHSLGDFVYFSSLDPFKQCECLYNVSSFSHRDFPFLPNLKEISVTSESLVNISNLSHLKNVKLERCDNVIDISGLQNVPVLTIRTCKNIENFSFLGKQISLILENLTICDVSHLGNVYDLKLRSCPEIEDISGLGKANQQFV
jgi:hypothetical protein